MIVVFFFLPGRPVLWLVLAWGSLLIALVQYILNRKQKFLHVPELVKPLILLALVTLVTAKFRGGIGLQSLGSDTYGGKRYFIIITSVVGYFALISQRIPPHRVMFFVMLYFLSAATILVGELAVIVSPAFYFIFLLFPVGSAGIETIMASPVAGPQGLLRLSGLASAASACYLAMMCRFGIQQIFTLRHVGRLILFVLLLFMAMYGGFRSILILFLLTFAILFYLEGLMRSSLMPIFLIGAILSGAIMAPMVNQLPLVVQRSLSFLPLPVDPMIKAGAQASTEWRLQMWKHVLPEVPEYLWLGKGYSFTAKDLALVRISATGTAGTEGAELAGDYHNGPLSLLIPFGLPGTISFVWFLVAAYKVLKNNYLFGDQAFRRINTFLLAYFLAKIIFFFGIFGSFYGDFPGFIGLVAMSICINGGMVKPAVVPQPQVAFNRFRLQPPSAKPVSA
jgi:hypothetical protein